MRRDVSSVALPRELALQSSDLFPEAASQRAEVVGEVGTERCRPRGCDRADFRPRSYVTVEPRRRSESAKLDQVVAPRPEPVPDRRDDRAVSGGFGDDVDIRGPHVVAQRPEAWKTAPSLHLERKTSEQTVIVDNEDEQGLDGSGGFEPPGHDRMCRSRRAPRQSVPVVEEGC